jgi:DNA polymerase-1
MLVTASEFHNVIDEILKCPDAALDCETTGLMPYHGHRLFSVIVDCAMGTYYFDFNKHSPDPLPRSLIPHFQRMLARPDMLWFLMNAKFDKHMLAQEGLFIEGQEWDIEVAERIIDNDHVKYSLSSIAPRYGFEKSDVVEAYIKKHKLWDWVLIPGKKKREKNKYFELVPLEIMQPYGEVDGQITRAIGLAQVKELTKWEAECASAPEEKKYKRRFRPLTTMQTIEQKVTDVLFHIERRGAMVDVAYINEALAYEAGKSAEYQAEFQALTGVEFKDSEKILEPVFAKLGMTIYKTESGESSFTDEILKKYAHPVAEAVRNYRDAHKNANTYYRSFLFYKDANNAIHPDFRQAGTRTMRLSCANPNFQNIPAEEPGPYFVRKCFVPRPEHFYVAIDYRQMELRMMLDYAGELSMIEKILADFDPHQAAADLTGLTRKNAKIMAFGILYGMGIRLLAETLGCSLADAKEFRWKYLHGLPNVSALNETVKQRVSDHAQISNFYGRVYTFHDKRFSYKALNYLIQGGCSDVVKKAMIGCAEFLRDKKSAMVSQVHDELLFEIHKDEIDIVPEIQKIMENQFPYVYLPLTCSVEYSLKNWEEMKEWDGGQEARNSVQRTHGKGPKNSEGHLVL